MRDENGADTTGEFANSPALPEALRGEETQTADGPLHRPGAVDPIRLPPADPQRYYVIGEFARGGVGRVLEVRDLRLGRTVALKQMIRESDGAYVRFVREAMITARLEHPAIVPVHDIGRWPSGEPFYSMKRIVGRSLGEVIAAAGSLDERLGLLPNVIAVADAIAYAHSQGIIHRDLKPANVIVGAFGETVVIDWGLAKDLGSADEGDTDGAGQASGSGSAPPSLSGPPLTVAGAVMGTLLYMPPEQARGEQVDQRADVYAVGAMLYEVLAGVPPYHEARGSSATALEAVLAGPPAAVTEHQPGVPPDLAAVVRKAMARRPEDRYPSAGELADDLRHFQTGRAVSARAYSAWALFQRWLHRHRAVVATAALALTVLAIAGALGVQRVVAERNLARRRADELLLTQARGALDRDATEALAWLRTYPDEGEDWSGMRRLAMDAQSHGVARHAVRRKRFFAFTADSRAYVGAPDGKNLEIRDVESGALVGRVPHQGSVQEIRPLPDGHTFAIRTLGETAITLRDTGGAARVLPGHGSRINAMAVSPDGRWVASGSADGTVQLAPAVDGEGQVRVLRGHEGAVKKVVFSADGRWLLSVATEKVNARLWPVGGGEPRVLSGLAEVSAVAISPDGSLAALGQPDGSVLLSSTESGAPPRNLGTHRGNVNDVGFSPDGRWLASAGDDGLVLAWSVTTGERRRATGHVGAALLVKFSPDGRELVSGSIDGEVRLSTLDGDEDRALGRSPGRFYDYSGGVSFSPDGKHVASVGFMYEVRLWNVAGSRARVLPGHRGEIHATAFSPDGRMAATASEDGAVRLWDPGTGQGRTLCQHRAPIYWVAFSPDGARLASGGQDRTVRLWDVAACGGPAGIGGCSPEERALEGHAGEVDMVVFSPDGRQLASAGADVTVRVWDVATGEARALRGPPRGSSAVAFSPDGRQLATAGEGHDLWLWDLGHGTGRPLSGHADRVFRVVFSRDGRWLVSSSLDQTLRRWDTATGATEVLAERVGTTPKFALSPDDRTLAFGGEDGRVQLLDVATRAARTLGEHRGRVSRLVFSRDGAALASGSDDRTVRLWDPRTGVLTAVLRHEAEVLDVALSPDGGQLVSVGAGGTARLWPIASWPATPTDRPALRSWMASLSTAAIDAQQRVFSP